MRQKMRDAADKLEGLRADHDELSSKTTTQLEQLSKRGGIGAIKATPAKKNAVKERGPD